MGVILVPKEETWKKNHVKISIEQKPAKISAEVIISEKQSTNSSDFFDKIADTLKYSQASNIKCFYILGQTKLKSYTFWTKGPVPDLAKMMSRE